MFYRTAFPLWILAMALSFMVLRYCGYFLMMTGGCLWLGNVLWASVRFGSTALVIPFNEDKKLTFTYGTTFYLCLVAGKSEDIHNYFIAYRIQMLNYSLNIKL